MVPKWVAFFFAPNVMLAPTLDPLLTVDEVAALLKLSRDTVIKIFACEPGVIDMGSPFTTKRARRYRVLRIPQSVINRVLARRRKQ